MSTRKVAGGAVAIVGTLGVINGALFLLSMTWLITDWTATVRILGFAALGAAMIRIGLLLSEQRLTSPGQNSDTTNGLRS